MEPLLESGRQSLGSIGFLEIDCRLCVIDGLFHGVPVSTDGNPHCLEDIVDVLDVHRACLPETLCGEPEPSSEGRPLGWIVSQIWEQIPSNQHEPLCLDLSKERD